MFIQTELRASLIPFTLLHHETKQQIIRSGEFVHSNAMEKETALTKAEWEKQFFIYFFYLPWSETAMFALCNFCRTMLYILFYKLVLSI